ncbi:hypothetical protein KBA63_00060 [Candidatus Woesebacteria bacterium]|nr:hypothetical protein [Candidatus Woesebacteria bacterium]
MPIIKQQPLYICSTCNAKADTQRKCHGLMDKSSEFITKTTLSQAELKTEKIKEAEIEATISIQKEQKRKEEIYKQIGELKQIKNTQIEIDGRHDATLDARISEIASQL